MNEFIVPVVLFISIAAVLIMRGPFGRALADRMAGRHLHPADPRDTERTAAELDEMRQRVAELESRMDFAERLLAKGRDRQHLEPGT